MIPIQGLFETHLTVANLDRAMRFYEETLGLSRATLVPDRRVAFYWLGAHGQAMLGLWETGTSPQRLSLHTAFTVTLEDLLAAPARLRAAGIAPLDLAGNPVEEPVVLAWMPAASLYFHDPDGNLLEYITMLSDAPAPERGVVPWSEWRSDKMAE
jgi:lactoylglutathione lyase